MRAFPKLQILLKQNDYWHGTQRVGQHFTVSGRIAGYYNDLSRKVLPGSSSVVEEFVPRVSAGGREHLHPVTVCQVGLGAYDLFIATGKEPYLRKALACADWLLANRVATSVGYKWIVPYEFRLFDMPKGFHSGLIQGQAISLLLRAFSEVAQDSYIEAAHSACDLMLAPIRFGGCRVEGTSLIEEYPCPAAGGSYSLVLNGYISAIWGLMDLARVTQQRTRAEAYEACIQDLVAILPRFDTGFWSRYCLKPNGFYYCNIASPYYHAEHVEQLSALHTLTAHPCFEQYRVAWCKYKESVASRNFVLLLKAGAVIGQRLSGLR